MTDPMKEAERLAGFHDAMEDSFSDRIRGPAPMRAKDHAEVAMVLRAVASDLAAAHAEIERLEHLLDLSKKTTEAVLERAEKAEAERDQAVAAAFEAAANIVVTGEPEISPITRHAITALTPADARAALEAYGREKVREGMKQMLNRLRHEGQVNPSLTYDDAIEWAESILAAMETLK